MIILKRSQIITKYDVFFAEKPSYKNWLTSYYMQSFYKKQVLGFQRLPKYTKIINITNSDYINSYDKTVAYEIKRSIKEFISFEIAYDIDVFISFYNDFALSKGLSQLKRKDIEFFNESLVITCAKKNNNDTIVYHTYLTDESIKRVRLLHSVSKIHLLNNDNNERNLIGRANKFLHFKDMEYFNLKGFKLFDFGGYSYGTNDRALQGINKFKDSFGGELIEESIYEAWPKIIIKNIFNKLKIKNN
jgi:hypothetical protein